MKNYCNIFHRGYSLLSADFLSFHHLYPIDIASLTLLGRGVTVPKVNKSQVTRAL